MNIKQIFGEKTYESDYRESLSRIGELIQQKDLLKIIGRYQQDVMSVFPTYFTKVIYGSITGNSFKDNGLAEAVGISALMSAPFDDAIDENLTRKQRASLIHAGILLSLIGLKNLEDQLGKHINGDRLNETIKFYLRAAIKATEGNENELYEERFDLPTYIEEYKISLTVPFTVSTKVACTLANTDKNTEKHLLEISENLGLMLRIANDLNNFDKHLRMGFVSIPVKYMKEAKMSVKSKESQKKAIIFAANLGLKAAQNSIERLDKLKLAKKDELYRIIFGFSQGFRKAIEDYTQRERRVGK